MSKVQEITIYDLAKELKVSVATISRALNNDPAVTTATRQRVSELAEKRGYRTNTLARGLRSQSTKTIGVIVPRLNSYFTSTVITGMQGIAYEEGYSLVVLQSFESKQKEIDGAKCLFRNRVDGLLVSLSYETDNLDHFQSFIQKDIPVILFDRGERGNSLTNVFIDNKKAAYEVTKHLLEQGCKRIAHITANSGLHVYADRYEGYKKALTEAGMTVKDKYVIKGDLGMEAGTATAHAILKMKQRPDAIFVANDNCAVGCIKALKQHGIRVPTDIAVAGFNNDPISIVIEPNLTTVDYQGHHMGEVAVTHLIDKLKGRTATESNSAILLPSSLIIRESSLKK
jgi:LacI family transcriptional regulator